MVGGCPGAPRASDLDVLLHAELRQGLFDAQGRQPGRSVGVPALPHDLPHDAQGLGTDQEQQSGRHTNTHTGTSQ